MAQLIEQLRQAIEASDETPAAIARRAGLARSQLSRLLSGETGLSAGNLERLADALGLEIIVRPKRRQRKA